MHLNKNPWARLDQCPPFLAHAWARTRGGKKRIPIEERVKISGLPERTYFRIARKSDWSDVKIGAARAFLKGCAIDPFNMRYVWRYLRKHQFQMKYLTRKQQLITQQICQQKLNQK